MRVLLMHNPSAGDEEHSRESLTSALAAAAHTVRWQSIDENGWQSALNEPADLVVVAGGDGTVRKVFKQLAGTDIPATLFPVGTANNIARSLGFEDDDPVRLIRGWPTGRTRACDIGSVASPSGEARFVESMGGGLFAAVLERAENARAKPAGVEKLELGLRLLREVIADAPALHWQAELDGVDVSGEALACEAMNVRETGPNVAVAPEADPGDGMLDAVLIREEHRAALADYVRARLDGRTAEPPEFDVRRGRRLAFRPPAGCPVHVDEEVLAVDAERDGITSAVALVSSRVIALVPARQPRSE
jgi:diacylglycerol kinase (ATP)